MCWRAWGVGSWAGATKQGLKADIDILGEKWRAVAENEWMLESGETCKYEETASYPSWHLELTAFQIHCIIPLRAAVKKGKSESKHVPSSHQREEMNEIPGRFLYSFMD